MVSHFKGYGTRSQMTPQSEPIPGSNQVPNNAGGWSYQVDDMMRLTRFLILNSTGGTFYIGERKLTKENLDAIDRLIKAGRGLEVVAKIVEISDQGRGVSNDPALFALARCCASDQHPWVPYINKRGETRKRVHPDDITVIRAAYAALPKVARTGTHFLHFQEYVKQFKGHGTGMNRALKAWYNDKRAESVAYQALKYQQRDGWSQRDVLRLARPKPVDSDHNAIYRWIVKGWESVVETVPAEEALRLIWAFERAKHLSDDNEVADLILKYGLPREAVPTTSLKSVKVWEALLEKMPLEAVTRNLATMTKDGVLVPIGAMTAKVVAMLRDPEAIKRARLHPIKILAALTTYASGKGVRGQNTWTPIQQIVDALNDAFYLSFDCVEPTGKRILIAIDTSGSMSSYSATVNGIPNLSCHQAAGAMALVTANSETNYHIIGVDTRIQDLPLSPKQRLDDVVRILGQYRGGGTNLALPMEYALSKSLQVDTFMIFTDGETWQSSYWQPAQALNEYRRRFNSQARIINVQMTSTHVTNNDPEDVLALEMIGMDTTTPSVAASFIKGEF